MIYKEFQDLKLSALGFGMMRLPNNGNDADINGESVDEMINYALENGVNYFDTAWGYHNGNSEIIVGQYLSKHPRDSYYLATKFPGYDTSNFGKVEEIFEKQLEKCNVEYFDFYLIHNVCSTNIEQYLDEEKYHTVSYLLEQKKNGRIKHLGFSTHAEMGDFKRFLDAYGEHMEFCQVQLNYMDWHFQHVDQKVKLLNEMNIPVWVMEPVRGGKLASLDTQDEAKLKELRPDEDAVSWCFRFLQSVEGVTMVLSGMSNLDQMKANIETFCEEKPLNEAEFGTIVGIADKMTGMGTLPCTGCRYCTSYCPMGLEIPDIIQLYNESRVTQGGFIAPMAIAAMDNNKRPSACIGCRSCEGVCPQEIAIADMMQEMTKFE